ncbi:MAG: preprotein translocase subunit YajC [Eubacteriales bacterium]
MSQYLYLLADATEDPSPGGGLITMLVVLVGFYALLWFLMVRPQRKRQKALQQMQSEVKVGDPVLTNGGLYGKVVDIVNEVIIVEFGTNKSVRVPIQKEAVASIMEPNLTVVKEETEEE